MTDERTGKGQPMTDDTWRRDRDDEEDEPLFGDHEPTRDQETVDDGLTFGASDTGSLPHWTEPPTGELPTSRPEPRYATGGDRRRRGTRRLVVVQRPSHRCGRTIPTTNALLLVPGVSPHGQHEWVPNDLDALSPREPSRITIGTDPSGMPRRPPVQTATPRGAAGWSSVSSPHAAPARLRSQLPVQQLSAC